MRTCLITLFLLASTAPATAEDFKFVRELSHDWTIGGGGGTNGQGSCIAISEWPSETRGTTKLALWANNDGAILLTLTNRNWSAVQDAEYGDIQISTEDNTYTGGKSLGVASGIDKGFSTWMPMEFLGDFGKARRLAAKKGDGWMADLDMVGSGAALATLKDCLRGVARADAEWRRDAEQEAHLAEDPFKASSKPSVVAP